MLSTVAYPLGGQGGRVPPLTAKNLPKIGKKSCKIRKKEEELGRKGKKREGSITLPSLQTGLAMLLVIKQ